MPFDSINAGLAQSFGGGFDGFAKVLPYLASVSVLPTCLTSREPLRLMQGLCLVVAGVAATMTLRGADSPQPMAPFTGTAASQPLPEPQPTSQAQPQTADDDGTIPRALQEDVFADLVANSPFTRTLGVSDSLILTGVAQFEQDVYATLLDTKTLESQVVSKAANFQGWQLVGVGGDPARMQTWTARIQVPGGEVVSIRYQKPPPKITRNLAGNNRGGSGGSNGGGPGGNGSTRPLSTAQMTEAKNAAVNYKEGFSSDGYPRQPPPEMVAKLSRLSVSQREDINRQMMGHSNQGLGLPERRKIYENLVEQAGRGR